MPGLTTRLDCWVMVPPVVLLTRLLSWAAAELELMLVSVEEGTLPPTTDCYYLLKEWIEVVDGILPLSSFRLTRLSVSFPFAETAAAPPTIPVALLLTPVFLKLPRRPRGSLRILISKVGH